MNLLKATELQTGGYHFTVTNDGHTRPHACCAQHDLTPHATAEEAERCKYEYDLKATRPYTLTSAHKCKECGEWTPNGISIGYGMPDQVTLCPEHQTPDLIRKHYPFASGEMSWES